MDAIPPAGNFETSRSPLGRKLRGPKPSSIVKGMRKLQGLALDRATPKLRQKPNPRLTDFEVQRAIDEAILRDKQESASVADQAVKYVRRLERRPAEANDNKPILPAITPCAFETPIEGARRKVERIMLANSNGTLNIRYLDYRFWMGRRSGFSVTDDIQWEFWMREDWQDRNDQYESAVRARRLDRLQKRKRNQQLIVEQQQWPEKFPFGYHVVSPRDEEKAMQP